MQKRSEFDWVGYVLRDVVTFLAENRMGPSAQILAVAAAHIDEDLKKHEEPAPTTNATRSTIVAFPVRTRRTN